MGDEVNLGADAYKKVMTQLNNLKLDDVTNYLEKNVSNGNAKNGDATNGENKSSSDDSDRESLDLSDDSSRYSFERYSTD